MKIFEGLLVQFSKVWLPINSPLCDRNFFGEKGKIQQSFGQIFLTNFLSKSELQARRKIEIFELQIPNQQPASSIAQENPKIWLEEILPQFLGLEAGYAWKEGEVKFRLIHGVSSSVLWLRRHKESQKNCWSKPSHNRFFWEPKTESPFGAKP